MSEAALEEVSVLSSIYCANGEFQLLQAAADCLVVQIHCTAGGDPRLKAILCFNLPPRYPSCPPDISVSSTTLSRTQSHSIRQKLLKQAASLPPEPMMHQLVQSFQQCVEEMKPCRGGEEMEEMEEMEEQRDDGWTAVLLLDHMRSQNHYIGLLQRWSQQLRLAGNLLLGQNILVILQGQKHTIKEFCHRLKTVKVDVDSSGKKCKERMMKVLIEIPSLSSDQHSLRGFAVKKYKTSSELIAVFQELHMSKIYQHICPSLRN